MMSFIYNYHSILKYFFITIIIIGLLLLYYLKKSIFSHNFIMFQRNIQNLIIRHVLIS